MNKKYAYYKGRTIALIVMYGEYHEKGSCFSLEVEQTPSGPIFFIYKAYGDKVYCESPECDGTFEIDFEDNNQYPYIDEVFEAVGM